MWFFASLNLKLRKWRLEFYWLNSYNVDQYCVSLESWLSVTKRVKWLKNEFNTSTSLWSLCINKYLVVILLFNNCRDSSLEFLSKFNVQLSAYLQLRVNSWESENTGFPSYNIDFSWQRWAITDVSRAHHSKRTNACLVFLTGVGSHIRHDMQVLALKVAPMLRSERPNQPNALTIGIGVFTSYYFIVNIARWVIDFLEVFIIFASSIFCVICVISNVNCVILEKLGQWNKIENSVIVLILNKHNDVEELWWFKLKTRDKKMTCVLELALRGPEARLLGQMLAWASVPFFLQRSDYPTLHLPSTRSIPKVSQ